MEQLISTVTRYGMKKNSILDLILVKATHISGYGTVNINLSDQLLVYFVKKKFKNMYEKCQFYGRCYWNYDKIVFQNALLKCDWSEFISLKTLNRLGAYCSAILYSSLINSAHSYTFLLGKMYQNGSIRT